MCDACDGERPHSYKLRVAAAFSPTSVTFAARQAKRPTGRALNIGATLAWNSGMLGRTRVSAHPYAESLRGFERTSLGSVTPVKPPQQQQQSEQYQHQHQHQQPERQEHTLAAPYRGADAARRALPSHLYFYALASSPMHPVSAVSTATAAVSEASTVVPGPVEVKIEEADAEATMGEAFYPPGAERKARLRYSRAPAPAGNVYHGAYGYNGGHPAYGTYGQTAYSNGSYAQQTAERTYSTSSSTQLSSSSSGSSSSTYIIHRACVRSSCTRTALYSPFHAPPQSSPMCPIASPANPSTDTPRRVRTTSRPSSLRSRSHHPPPA
ncbi:hypothetical protein DFH11DRAFT_591720 [Phellopilus nigrolimitatus]|nr:hypothetical protein DFH11DRAFT_591720 [Phellopilus nigrolimitatus]